MNDRELLELAAKAAGYSGAWIKWPGARHPLNAELGFFHGSDGTVWRPLSDDGDALRLAVKLHIDLKSWDEVVRVWVGDHESHEVIAAIEQPCGPGFDIYAATRRAIVLAAAEIGRRMK